MQIFNRLVNQATEKHGLRAGWDKAVFAEEHVLPRTLAVEQEIAGVRVALRKFLLFKLRGGNGRNLQLRNAWERSIEQVSERPVETLAAAAKVGEDEQVFRTRESDVEHAHHVEGRHAVERLAFAREEWSDHFLDALRLRVFPRVRENYDGKFETLRLMNGDKWDATFRKRVLGVFILGLSTAEEDVEEISEGVEVLTAAEALAGNREGVMVEEPGEVLGRQAQIAHGAFIGRTRFGAIEHRLEMRKPRDLV